MISVRGLQLQLGDFRLHDVSFDVPAGKYAVLMGATGCGKTSILEAICGLRSIASGSISLGDRDVTRLRPGERGVGLVPQDGALFPTMNVGRQIAFPLTVRKQAREQTRARVEQLAEELHISHLLARRPQRLSGGERQRVALARALATRPAVLCLDEPLSALDEATRIEVMQLLKEVQASTGVTALHVTHSHSEAAYLADVLFRLEDGRVRAEECAASPNVALHETTASQRSEES